MIRSIDAKVLLAVKSQYSKAYESLSVICLASAWTSSAIQSLDSPGFAY